MVTTAMDRKLEQLGTARVDGLYKNYVCTDRHLKLAFIYEVSQVLSDLTMRKYKKFIFTKKWGRGALMFVASPPPNLM